LIIKISYLSRQHWEAFMNRKLLKSLSDQPASRQRSAVVVASPGQAPRAQTALHLIQEGFPVQCRNQRIGKSIILKEAPLRSKASSVKKLYDKRIAPPISQHKNESSSVASQKASSLVLIVAGYSQRAVNSTSTSRLTSDLSSAGLFPAITREVSPSKRIFAGTTRLFTAQESFSSAEIPSVANYSTVRTTETAISENSIPKIFSPAVDRSKTQSNQLRLRQGRTTLRNICIRDI
jgi:hypothetical protein